MCRLCLLSTERAKADGQGPSSYAPIAQPLHTFPKDEQKKFQYKFDIAYLQQ